MTAANKIQEGDNMASLDQRIKKLESLLPKDLTILVSEKETGKKFYTTIKEFSNNVDNLDFVSIKKGNNLLQLDKLLELLMPGAKI